MDQPLNSNLRQEVEEKFMIIQTDQLFPVPVLAPETECWDQRTCYIADPEGKLIEIGSFNRPFTR